MVAVPVTNRPTSLLEDVAVRAAGRAKRRAERTGRSPGEPGALVWWLQELWGTVAAFAVFTTGAFLYLLPVAGFGVLGVSILVFNAKVSIGVGKRRAERVVLAEAAAEPPKPVPSGVRIVRE